ncbi:MAG: Rho termination factor [Micrococcales bacterium]|nr:Rho termination factor [Micrococcales bacterium]
MPGPLPDPNLVTIARLREAAEQLRAAPEVPDGTLDDSASTDYEDWTLARLRRRATELDIEGRSAMDKAGLVAALRALPPGPDDDTSHHG